MDGGDKRLIPMKLQVSSKFHAKPASGTLSRHVSAFQLCTRLRVQGRITTLIRKRTNGSFISCKTKLRITFVA